LECICSGEKAFCKEECRSRYVVEEALREAREEKRRAAAAAAASPEKHLLLPIPAAAALLISLKDFAAMNGNLANRSGSARSRWRNSRHGLTLLSWE
jgi:hypothetical protein